MKTVLWLILALLLLSGIGLGVFVATFDPNSYRALLGKTVERSTGRRLSIDGDLSLAIWPNIALRAEQLSLANPEGFDAEPMLRAEALEATIALRPLLQREVKIDGVVLYAPAVILRENAQGQNNWSDLQTRFTQDNSTPSESSSRTEIQLSKVSLEKATISLLLPDQELRLRELNATLEFTQASEMVLAASGSLHTDINNAASVFSLSTNLSQSEGQTLLEQLQLHMGLGSNDQLELSIPRLELAANLQEARIERGSASVAGSTLNFSATFTELQTNARVVADVTTAGADTSALLSLAALELPDSVPAAQLGELDGKATLSSTLAGSTSGAFEVHNFTARLSGLEAQVTGHASTNASGGVKGQLQLLPLNLQSLARALPDLLEPNLFLDQARSPTLQALQSDFSWQPAQPGRVATLNFTNTRLEVLGLSAALSGTTRLTDPVTTTTTRVTLAEFSPKQVLTYFSDPVLTEDPQALSTARGTLTLHQDATGTHLRDLNVSIDESQLSGEISLLEAPIPTLRFNATLDRLTAGNYLTPTDSTPSGSVETTDVLGDLVLPTELLRAYDLNGSFSIKNLQLFDLRLDDVGARIVLGDGRAQINNLSTRLYGGSFIGKVGFRELDDAPELAITGDLQRIHIASLMQALSNTADFTGRGNVQINMTGRGANALAAVQSAAGSFGLQLEDGTYTGINFGHELCKLYNRVRGKPAPPTTTNPATSFDTFSATATVTEGRAQTDDLLASNSYLKITGTGATQLAQQSIDYDLDVELTGPIEETNCDTLTPYIGSRIPVRITGNFATPTLRPDFGKLAKREIRRRVEEKITEKLLDLLGGKKAEDAPQP